jgi:hypothetical protein
MSEERLVESRRQEVFRALVEAQDRGVGVVGSRKEVAKRFGLSDRQIRQIEHEGLNNDWPPL